MTQDKDDDDALAAEFVIGLLDHTERETVKNRITQDAGFERRVHVWAEHLENLNADYAEAVAPRRIKNRVDQTLFGSPRSPRIFWKTLGLIATAAVLAIALGVQLLTPDQSFELQAQLEGSDPPFGVSVAVDRDTDLIEVRVTEGDLPPDGTLELWLLPEDGAPQSLGTFDARTEMTNALAGALQAGATLAVSQEPFGGSPTGLPTGPVLAVGNLEDA